MEKDRSSKVLAIVALLIGVVGLSLGFAAFSKNLSISPSATVKPKATDFKVVFSSSSDAVTTTPVVAVSTPNTIETSDATIANTGDPKITNLGAEFTAPGQKVVYSFYAANTGEYDAYLKSITFKKAEGGTASRECTANVGTTDALVQTACNDITLKIKVGDELETDTSLSSTDIVNHKLEKGAFELITVTIEYAADGARADGDFSVAFGNIVLNYGSNE